MPPSIRVKVQSLGPTGKMLARPAGAFGQCQKDRDKIIPGAPWPASLSSLVGSKPMKPFVSEEAFLRMTSEVILWPPHLHVPADTHIHTQTHTQRQSQRDTERETEMLRSKEFLLHLTPTPGSSGSEVAGRVTVCQWGINTGSLWTIFSSF